MVLIVVNDDDNESVAAVDGGCTHLFVEVRVAYGNNSEIVVSLFRICL